MKQWLILIFSIIIIIFSGIYEIKYLQNTSNYLVSDIDYCKSAIESNNFKLAQDHIENVYTTWNYLNTVWSIFVDHDEIGNIDEELLQFKLYIQEEDKKEAVVACEELKRIIEHSVEKQKLNIANVF